MDTIPEIQCQEIAGLNGAIGLITLNRPQALNALNHNMISALQAILQAWAKAPTIKAVVIQSSSRRAFCTGGDLRALYEHMMAQDKAISRFFHDEYQLNQFIFNYPKPYIALLDGMTMGGGAGISIHGSHRVATDQLIFAMPETGIGFFPDVGASYFLSHLAGQLGFYLGLTGARLSTDDCMLAGLVDFKMAWEKFPEFIQQLAATSLTEDPHAKVTQCIKQCSLSAPAAKTIPQHDLIERYFSYSTVEEIRDALMHAQDAWCQQQAAILQTKSPTSLKVTLEVLFRSKPLDFAACMQQEYQLAQHFLQTHDFVEGIRAAIIDKDHQPQWQPPRLEEITNDKIAYFFAPFK